MKNSIVFNVLILCVIFATSYVTANETVTQQTTYKCDLKHIINANTFDQKNKGVNQFIYSNRYCINEPSSRDIIKKSILPTRTDVRRIVKRYKEVYNTLEKTNEKVAFVDLFLQVASQKHHISLNNEGYKKDSIRIILSSYNPSNRTVSGYYLSLFQDDKIDKKISTFYAKYLSKMNAETRSSDLINIINYVLDGNSKKLLESSSLLPAPLRVTYTWGGEWEYYWDENESEEWLVMENSETSEVVSAYYFSPKSQQRQTL